MNRQLNRLLSTCPKGKGQGIHQWLFLVARFLHRYPYMLKPRAILQCLREATKDCQRKVTEKELRDAVNNSKPVKGNAITSSGNGSGSSVSSLPPRDENYRAKAIKAGGINLEGLINCESEIFSPQYTLKLLYPDHPLLCFVHDREKPGGIATGYWSDPRLRPSFPPLMVPNPLLGEWGYTQEGNRSERALSNVGKRRYLIQDFDSGSRDEQAAIIWFLRQQWQKQHVPLVMVLDSGRRSLHGWFDVRHLDEPEIWKLCRQAYRLGADSSTFGKQQLVRVPGAFREEEKKYQPVYYSILHSLKWQE